MKEALKFEQENIGMFFAGGKGKSAINTPNDIDLWIEKRVINFNFGNELKKISKIVAKFDSIGLQDCFQIYHHFLVFTKSSNWAIIEQGMNN